MNAIRTAHEQLMYATQGFAQRLYETSGSQPGGNGAGAGTGTDDDVVDAEIVDG
jgi:molecular chaperone DnaK